MDFASSTSLDERVGRLMDMYRSKHFANPSSLHKEGVAARSVINESRQIIAHILGVHSDEIIFTSGGTEGDTMVIQGVINAYHKSTKAPTPEGVGTPTASVGTHKNKETPHVVTTNIEHSAVQETCRFLEKEGGIELTEVPVEANGIVRPEIIKKALKENTVLVSVMYANNEIGTIQPIQEIAKVIRKHRKTFSSQSLFFHTDAAQAINYLPIRVEKLGVDLLTFNGSKIYGPRGMGVLYKKRDVQLLPLFYGGHQEFGLRPGTENVSAIAGMAEALKITEEMKEKESKRLTELQKYFILRLRSEFPNIIVNGSLENRLPNNVNISISGIESELLVIELDAMGIAVSSKSACKSDDPDESYVITALREVCDRGDLSSDLSTKAGEKEESSIRFSFGRGTSKKDIDYVSTSLKHIFTKLNRWVK